MVKASAKLASNLAVHINVRRPRYQNFCRNAGADATSSQIVSQLAILLSTRLPFVD